MSPAFPAGNRRSGLVADLPNDRLRHIRLARWIVETAAAGAGVPQLITTRKIAARKGMKPIHVWPELQAFSKGGSLGQGFYERELIESWLGGS